MMKFGQARTKMRAIKTFLFDANYEKTSYLQVICCESQCRRCCYAAQCHDMSSVNVLPCLQRHWHVNVDISPVVALLGGHKRPTTSGQTAGQIFRNNNFQTERQSFLAIDVSPSLPALRITPSAAVQ